MFFVRWGNIDKVFIDLLLIIFLYGFNFKLILVCFLNCEKWKNVRYCKMLFLSWEFKIKVFWILVLFIILG